MQEKRHWTQLQQKLPFKILLLIDMDHCLLAGRQLSLRCTVAASRRDRRQLHNKQLRSVSVENHVGCSSNNTSNELDATTYELVGVAEMHDSHYTTQLQIPNTQYSSFLKNVPEGTYDFDPYKTVNGRRDGTCDELSIIFVQ